MFRTTTKSLRFYLQGKLHEAMTQHATPLEKCILGNIMALRNDLAHRELNEHICDQTAVRDEHHSFLFRELYGEELLTDEWKTSDLLDTAANWMIDNDINTCFQIEGVSWKYRDTPYSLPLITGFSVRGTGIMKDVNQFFGVLK